MAETLRGYCSRVRMTRMYKSEDEIIQKHLLFYGHS